MVEVTPQYIGQIIKDGFYDPLVLIGFPYDQGAKSAGSRAGSDLGPDSFRRFLKMNNIGSINNPEYSVDISKIKICDYGNIQIDAKADIKQLYAKLATKLGLCYTRKNIPFIIGGSRDLLQAVCDADNSPPIFVCITPVLDYQSLLDTDLCNQTSVHRYLTSKGKTVISFGVDGSRVSSDVIQVQDNIYYSK